jgi:hypothetical protein
VTTARTKDETPMTKRLRAVALVVVCVAACVTACSSESTSPAGGTKDAGVADAATAADAIAFADANRDNDTGGVIDAGRPLYGTVLVEFVPETHAGFLAVFYDGPSPALMPLDLRQEQAGCQLLVPRPLACVPACAAGSICAGTNSCTAQPKQVDVGLLHVEGLGGMTHDVQPTAPNVLVYQIVPSLSYPPCAEGDDVKVSANGFAMAGKCISALTVTSPAPIPVTAGQPTRLAWTPPGRAGISRIHIELEISHHGGLKGQIECDVPDTGSFEIPAPLITALVNLGRAGYPTVKLTRTSATAAPTHPGVKLTIVSQVERDVDTGVISCGAPGSPPCPAGTMCQIDFTCGPMR